MRVRRRRPAAWFTCSCCERVCAWSDEKGTSVWTWTGERNQKVSRLTREMFLPPSFGHSVTDSLTVLLIWFDFFCDACQLISDVYWKRARARDTWGRRGLLAFLYFFFLKAPSGRACLVYSESFLRLHQQGHGSSVVSLRWSRRARPGQEVLPPVSSDLLWHERQTVGADTVEPWIPRFTSSWTWQENI